jgi:hypothetical protein
MQARIEVKDHAFDYNSTQKHFLAHSRSIKTCLMSRYTSDVGKRYTCVVYDAKTGCQWTTSYVALMSLDTEREFNTNVNIARDLDELGELDGLLSSVL